MILLAQAVEGVKNVVEPVVQPVVQAAAEVVSKPEAIGFLESVLKVLSDFGAGGAIVGVSIAVEFLLRIIPSSKPKSIMYLVSDVCKVLGLIFQKAAEVLDKVLGQRLKS